MKHSEQDQLLQEILIGDELSNFREASLEDGLTSIRQHHQRRRALRLCSLASLPILLALVIVLHRTRESPTRHVTSSGPPPPLPAPRAETRGIRFITDEELFALFPNRPLALIGKPGQQQLVFLDQPARQSRSQ